jgi:hypothetical protein
MFGLAVTANLEDVEEACEIGVKIGVRMIKRVPYTGLHGEMHDRAKCAVREHRLGKLAVGKIEAMKAEILKLPQHRKPRLFKPPIVVGIDIVNADNRAATLKQAARQREPDEAGAPVIRTSHFIIAMPFSRRTRV